jgi:hypothetical protein
MADSLLNHLLVEVYRDSAPFTLVDVLNARWDPTYLSELKAHGAGGFKISKRDPKILANPSLLEYRNIIRLKMNNAYIGGFIIQTVKAGIVGQGEESDEVWEVSGEGFRSWSRDAAVQPSKGLKKTSAETRYFNFATERGPWYHAEDWNEPERVMRWNQTPWPYPFWRHAPAEWPDVPGAWWIWSEQPINHGGNVGIDSPEGYNFFRHEFTTTVRGSYSFFFAIDDQADVFVDGELLMSTNLHSWSETIRLDFELDPGSHVIGIKGFNRDAEETELNHNPGGFIGALFQIGDPAQPTSAKLLSYTGQAGKWKVNGYPETDPGWTPGDILLTLLAEADARGVRFAQNLVPTFTVSEDSAGEPWDEPVPMSFDIGATYEDVFEALEELGCDIYVDPATLELHVWKVRGFDRTMGVSEAPVVLIPGRNLISASETGQAEIVNHLLIHTPDGWFQDTALGASVEKYGRIESQISTDLTGAAAGKLINTFFAQKSLPELSATYELVPIPGAFPYVDFNVGDYISTPGSTGSYDKRRIMSIAMVEDTDTGEPRFVVEFDKIFKDRQSELEKWVSRTSHSRAIGGGFTNSTSTPSSVIKVPPGMPVANIPDAPTGLTVSTVGFWGPDGSSTSDYGLTWNPVISGEGFGEVMVSHYEVWGRKSSQLESQRLTIVYDAMAYLSGYTPGDTWVFKVCAVSRQGGTGEFSEEVALEADPPMIPLPTPSAPTLTSARGTVTVIWDGLLDGGQAPMFLRNLRVERATAELGPWTQVGTIMGGSVADTSVTVGTEYWYRLIATDFYGNESDPSPSASIVAVGVEAGDISGDIADAITEAQENADAALTLVNGKNKNYYQPGKPVGGTYVSGDLWFDTDDGYRIYSWDTTANDWVPRPLGNAALGSIDAGKITSGYIDAGRIAAKSLTSEHVIVANTTNEIPNGDFWEGANAWTGPLTVSDGVATLTPNATVRTSLPVSVTPGEEWLWSISYTTSPDFTAGGDANANAKFSLRQQDGAGAVTSYLDLAVGDTAVQSGSYVVPEGTRSLYAEILFKAPATGTVYVSSVRLTRMANSQLIVDGAITARKIGAESITAEHIGAEVINANHIEVGSITVDKLESEFGSIIDLSDNDGIKIISDSAEVAASTAEEALIAANSAQGTAEAAQDTADNTARYYRFTTGSGLVIGNPAEKQELRLDNDEIAIYDANTKVTWWNSGQLNVSNLKTTESIQVGNHLIEKYSTSRTTVRLAFD